MQLTWPKIDQNANLTFFNDGWVLYRQNRLIRLFPNVVSQETYTQKQQIYYKKNRCLPLFLLSENCAPRSTMASSENRKQEQNIDTFILIRRWVVWPICEWRNDLHTTQATDHMCNGSEKISGRFFHRDNEAFGTFLELFQSSVQKK